MTPLETTIHTIIECDSHMTQEEATIIVRDVLEAEYFGDHNREQATELAVKVIEALAARAAAERKPIEKPSTANNLSRTN